MKTLVTTLLVLLPIVSLRANENDTAFEKLAKEYVEGVLQAQPEYATELGDHRFDDRLSDYSDAAEAKELQRAKGILERLQKFNQQDLTGPNKVDVRLLRDNVESEIFQIEELKERE